MEKWPLVVQGDVEAAIIDIIRSAPEIQAFPGGAPQVRTTLDGFQAPMRWVVVSLEGGSFKWPLLVRARIDVNVFAETRTAAHDLVQLILAVLHREAGQPSAAYGVRITKHRIETGPIRADDRLNDSPRYVFSLRTQYVPYDGA